MKIVITAIAALTMWAATVNAGDNLPANWQAVALTVVKASLKDPDSLRQLVVPPQTPREILGYTFVTVLVNAKNSFGAYTGLVPVRVCFRGGRVVDIDNMSRPSTHWDVP